MSAIKISYDEAREKMQPGDVIAFGGTGAVSELIKFATSSEISHVGVVLQTKVVEDATGRFFNQIVESTGSSGVRAVRFSDKLSEHKDEVWWLPLKKEIRENSFDQGKFFNYLFNEVKKKTPYDLPQAIGSGIDILDTLPFGIKGPGHNREDFSKFFCSELVSAGFEVAGTIPSINSSEVTPIDLCRWDIYEDSYYQLQGDCSKKITRYNTANPADWRD